MSLLQPFLPFLILLALCVRPTHTLQLAFESCNAATPCADHLICATDTTPTHCPPTPSTCTCRPSDPTPCDTSDICHTGERCVKHNLDTVCMSCKTATIANVTFLDRNPSSCSPFLAGYTGDFCGHFEDPPCIPPRFCATSVNNTYYAQCSIKDHHCYCRPSDTKLTECSKSMDCPSGERCVRQDNILFCQGCHISVLNNTQLVDNDESNCITQTPPPPSGPYQGGFAWDLCTADSTRVSASVVAECQRGLQCWEYKHRDPGEIPMECDTFSQRCNCLSFAEDGSLRNCDVSDHCPRGERCVAYTNPSEQVCTGCHIAAFFTQTGTDSYVDLGRTCLQLDAKISSSPMTLPITITPSPMKLPPTITPSSSPLSLPRGFSFDSCAGDRDICRGNRTCEAVSASRACGRDDTECACIPPKQVSCTTSAVCPGGERCAVVNDGNVCVACTLVAGGNVVDGDENCWKGEVEKSPSPSPPLQRASSLPSNPSPSSSPSSPASSVCVAVHHLTEMSERQLVFGAHREAWVWCDTRGSCATGGHLVVWRGTAMRMQRYCESVGGCARKRMLVNSPRWRRGLRVRSGTEGLQFTALAARWETALEERMLATMIRMGA